MKKQLFFTIALFCSSVLSFGQFLGQNFYQNGDNRIYYNTTSLSPLTVSVGTSFTFNLTDVVIPSTVSYNGNTYAVTGILNQGFQNRTTLTSISIPDSVTKIGENAFYNCNNLNVASISNTSQLNIIDYQAFYACNHLTSINIPDSVTQINESSFDGCSALSTVNITNTSSLTTLGASAFSNCSSLTSINIPNTVNSIGYDAFSDCSALTSIIFPSLVTNLADGVLYNCTGLTSFTIPNTITSIGEGTFYGCTGFTSITIPNSVTSIGQYAFQACSGLTSFTFPNSIATITEGLLYECTALTSITIPSSVTSIESRAFAGCTALTSVTVNNLVPLVIDSSVFQNLDTSTIKLYVPTGTGNAYEAEAFWTNFIILEPLAANQMQSNVNCFGGNTGQAEIIITNGVAPYTFAWSNGGTSALQTELTAGTYTCIVTDSAMNSITLTFTITQPNALLKINQYQTDVSCRNGSNGTISVYPTGGILPYTYVWADGDTSQSRSGLAARSYSVVVTDNNGCTATKNFNIYQPAAIVVAPTQTNVSCGGVTLGSISLTTFGGIAPYNYLWENGSTSADRTGLTEGSYSVVISDANTCTITRNFEITQPIPTDNVTSITSCGSYFWANDGLTYFTSGVYQGTTTNCLTEKLDLTITPNTDNITTISACDSYTWNGTVYSTSGIKVGSTTDCVTEKLNLTITPSATNTTTVSAVGNYIWPVNSETLSTTLIGYEFPNGNCNTEVLNLTIIPATVSIIYENGVLNAVTNAPNATYQWYNCATEQNIAGQTGANFTLTQSTGSYNVTIRINGILSGSSGCFNYNLLANNTFSEIAGLDIYPNPSTGIFNLKLPSDLQIEVYNNLGQLLSSEKMFSGSNVINISDKPVGVYFLKANDGNNVSTFKIIKN